MAITDSTIMSSAAFRFRPTVLVFFGLMICNSVLHASAAEIGGSIKAGVANSDNIFLAPSPNQTSETIYWISPGINFDYNNQRIESSLQYEFDWYRYSDIGSTNRYHRYNVRVNGELVEDRLDLEIGGTQSQSIADADAIIPASTLPISNNFLDRAEYYITPRLDTTIGRSLSVIADYRYSVVDYKNSNSLNPTLVQDNVNQNADFKIANYKRGRGITWALAYEWRETDYEDSLPWEYKRAIAELGVWVGENTRIFSSGGKESAWDDPVDRSLQDELWDVGFVFTSGETLSAEFAVGERSFGSSWRGELDFTYRRGSFGLSYRETPTTNGFNNYRRGNLNDTDEPNDYLAQPGGSERFIRKRGQASLSFDLRRVSVGFIAYDETRSGRFSDEGLPLSNQEQNGFSTSIFWQAGARTGLTAKGSLNFRETESSGRQDFITASLNLDYRLGSNVGLSLGYDYTEQDPQGTSTTRDYVANVVSLFATYSF